MEKDGQLTFSDNPLPGKISEALRLIEEGQFADAARMLGEMLDENPDYPGLIEGYRTARFWANRYDEFRRLGSGRETADYLMHQWTEFETWSKSRQNTETSSWQAARKFVFFTAAEHYAIAFRNDQSPTDNFNLLLNLGVCFITLREYRRCIETLEYARTTYTGNARLLAMLAESYFHTGEIPKSLLFFREAFLIDPAEIDLALFEAQPLRDALELTRSHKSDPALEKEWLPVIAYIEDIFHVRRPVNNQQIDALKRDIYSLERSIQSMPADRSRTSSVLPRLINRYLWMYDYFHFQNYNFDHLSDIRARLLELDRTLFEPYFHSRQL